jgi:hypothetical protein
MLKCGDMKVGQVLTCGECGLELQVVKECDSCSGEDATCSEETCTFECCGRELLVK